MQKDNTDINNLHIPVLFYESISSLQLKPGSIVVDATVNRAGHALEIVKAIGSTGTLIIFDLDKDALDYSKNKLESLENAPQIFAFHTNYRNIKSSIESLAGISSVDAIFADFGLSSQELDMSGRGFSFQKDEPLYMTFYSTPEDGKHMTAMNIVNELSVDELTNIFKAYGDEDKAWYIAKGIVEYRETVGEIKTTGELVKIIENSKNKNFFQKSHPATKVFQAIRIAVNDEYDSIREFLNSSYDLLKKGGVLSIITFHSGEDRIVKQTYKTWELESKGEIIEKVKPSEIEIKNNRRSRSALLRSFIKN
jgi:16S rRNA (cytosine1402-N4)-methyltransferase